MATFLADLERFFNETDDLIDIPSIVDSQTTRLLGSARIDDTSNEWNLQRRMLEALLTNNDESGLNRAIRIFYRLIETLDVYAPALKGLQDVHSFTCESLESAIFDRKIPDKTVFAAAYLYGKAMAMSILTDEAVSMAVENILLRNEKQGVEIAICILLGVEQSSPNLFEAHLPLLLRQIQSAANREQHPEVGEEALVHAMQFYAPNDRVLSCQMILQTTHVLLESSLKLCENKPAPRSRNMDGLRWCCFILQNTPMLLRVDLITTFPETCDAVEIFRILSLRFRVCNTDHQMALCGALPVLVTWNTSAFCDGPQVREIVDFMCRVEGTNRAIAMKGLGYVASVVLDRFDSYLPQAGAMALGILAEEVSLTDQKAAQHLLRRLLASVGPLTMDIMIKYLQCRPDILLDDVELLEMIAMLLPNLAGRITQVLLAIIDDVLDASSPESIERNQSVLQALVLFPLKDDELAKKSQRLVLFSLDEEKGRGVVIAALQVATNPRIATFNTVYKITTKVAELLLAEDPHIVHMGLSVLSNPLLASTLDERSCSMILLALHQSLEPSIQIVAAKLLTHLTTVHRAIVQPLAWSHIRQSLNLMEFLHNVDRTRAIVEACIISNLLPALPPSLHKKYVAPIKELILSALNDPPTEANTLSLIFQGLANLAKFEGWGSAQQSSLVLGLLEMSQEIPKDSQHAALNAISRLLSVPQEGLDVYDILVTVHATFGGRSAKLDADLKALVSGIYGHLGTVERNPVISRDSRAAINRETSVYTPKTILRSQVAEVRDKSGANSQNHVNWLVSKTLYSALTPTYKASEERALVLEIMTALGILQPTAIPSLIPELPSMIIREIKLGLELSAAKKDTTRVAPYVLFLSAALHTSSDWLEQYWTETAEIMGKCIDSGDSMAVLKGLDVILNAISD